MRLTAILLTAFCLNVAAAGHTQGITLRLKNAPLEKVFSEIKKQTGYSFVYNNNLVATAKKVDLQVSSASIEEVLDKCFKDQPFTYTIVDKTIIVKPREDKSPNGENESPDHQITRSLIDISGRVTDADGNPLAGASVKVKGSSLGTTTNNDGVFTLKGVNDNATLEISFVGYETYTVAVNNKTAIAASLKLKPESLNEVIINKGYYTEKQRFTVGNVGKVTAKDIEKQPVQNPLLALQGRVPGLVVTQANGLPGGGVTVRIQGRNSIIFGNDPLYVIDGVPFFNQLPATNTGDGVLGSSGGMSQSNSFGSPLNYLNPNDIESIEVLKDADATAIYGSRAANGAILITTKRGKAGEMKLSLNLQNGWGRVGNKFRMLNTREYLDMRYEALKNDNINLYTQSNTSSNFYDLKVWDTSRYTDWQKELIGGTANYTTASANISGGTSQFQYLIGGTYNRQTTVFPGDFNDQRVSLHLNINSMSPNGKLRVQYLANFMHDLNRLLKTDLTKSAMLLEPNAPALYNDDGTLNWAPNVLGNSTWQNPLASMNKKYHSKTLSLVNSLTLNYQLLPGLDLKSNLGYTALITNDFGAEPFSAIQPEARPNSLRAASYGDRDLSSWIFEPQLNYRKIIGVHDFDFLIGGTLQNRKSESSSIDGLGYNSDDVLENRMAAAQLFINTQYNVIYKYSALFGRVNYNLSNKYIINATWRRDGTSRFGPESQFHNFGSIGGAWIFSESDWASHQSILSFGKLRGSYGSTGSDQIGDYAFMSLYNFVSGGLPYQNSVGIFPLGIANSFLQWEETKKLQVGLDLGFFSDRVSLSTTYGRNRSSNQLLSYVVPSTTGFTAFSYNLPATVQNTTWEFALSTTNFQGKNLKWTSNFNLSIPRNELLKFPGLNKSPYAGQMFIGEPLGTSLNYKFAGIAPSNGMYTYFDIHGNPTNSPDFFTDRIALINTNPKFYGGFQNNIQFKGIDIDFLFQFARQLGTNYAYGNTLGIPGRFRVGQSNQPSIVLERWQKTGDIAQAGRFTTSSNGFNGGDLSYTDASFVRLKNLSISYRLPNRWAQKAHVKSWRLYGQGQNLWTITKWKGLDVETQNLTSLPPLRLWTFGLQVEF